MSLKKLSIFLLTGLLLTPVILGAGLYRWVDDKGIVHYGDTIPVKFSKLKREVVSTQGVVLGTLAAEKTKEQLRAEKVERKRLAELKRQALVLAERNRVLLSSYSSTADIDTVKDQKAAQLNKQIDLINLNSSNLKQQQQAIMSRMERVKDSEEEDRDSNLELMQTQLNDTNNNLRELQEKVSNINKEISDIGAYYQQEKLDFIRLVEEKEKMRQAENHPLN